MSTEIAKKRKKNLRFRPEMINEIAEMTGNGMTLKHIAAFYNVDDRTLYKWAKKYPGVRDALQLGRTWQAEKVVEALFKRAIGYEYEEVKQVVKTGIGKDGKPFPRGTHIEKVTKHVPPDPSSAMQLLKSILPDRFRDKYEIEHTGERPIVVSPEYNVLLLAQHNAAALENQSKDQSVTLEVEHAEPDNAAQLEAVEEVL